MMGIFLGKKHSGGALDAVTNGRADIICSAAPCTPANAFSFEQCTGACPALLFDAASGLYSYQGGVASSYTRTITIDRGIVDAAVPQADQMKVKVSVSWTDAGIPRQVELAELLYNWEY